MGGVGLVVERTALNTEVPRSNPSDFTRKFSGDWKLLVQLSCSQWCWWVQNWWILIGYHIVRFMKLCDSGSHDIFSVQLSSSGAEQRTSTPPSLWQSGQRLWIHSCPSDGDVKWRSWEQDWDGLVHTCLVLPLSTSRKENPNLAGVHPCSDWYKILDKPPSFPLSCSFPSRFFLWDFFRGKGTLRPCPVDYTTASASNAFIYAITR